jgi:integrase/recombinase XerC
VRATWDAFLADIGITNLDQIKRRDIEKWIVSQADQVSMGTVLTRFRSVRVLFNWCAEQNEIEISPMARMKEPHTEQRPPDAPSDEDVRRMLNARRLLRPN